MKISKNMSLKLLRIISIHWYPLASHIRPEWCHFTGLGSSKIWYRYFHSTFNYVQALTSLQFVELFSSMFLLVDRVTEWPPYPWPPWWASRPAPSAPPWPPSACSSDWQNKIASIQKPFPLHHQKSPPPWKTKWYIVCCCQDTFLIMYNGNIQAKKVTLEGTRDGASSPQTGCSRRDLLASSP